MGTDFFAGTAAHAEFLVNFRFSFPMLLHFAGSGAAAHADIFEGSAKTGHLMSLEMRQRNKYIRIHDRLTDLCLFYILSVNGYQSLVRSFQAISNDHMAACLKR